MRRKAIVSPALVLIGSLVIVATTCNPSFAQLGARLFGSGARRDRFNDPPPPKPPVPPMGMTIHAPKPPQPLPDPIPAPPVPKLDDVSSRPDQAEPADESSDAGRELSTEMAALRDGVRRTLLSYYNRPVNTQSNMPGDLIYFCMVYGPNAEVRADTTSAKTANAVAVLCSNYPCGGRYLLNSDGENFVPRIGYGLQSRQSELLAMLAMAGVSPEYGIQVGEARGTVADLVRWEKLDVRSGNDLSFTAVGLAHYLPDAAAWQNSLGETWSLERLAEEELNRQVPVTGPEAVDRLIGLTYIASRGEDQGTDLGGRLAQIEQYLASYQDHALDLQNSDGTWNRYFFGYRGTDRDTTAALRSTGHILEWLAMSLPEDRLQDPRVVRAVAQVNNILAGQASRLYLSALSPRDVATYMRALHALSIYNQRVFRPLDPPPETEQEEPEAEAEEASTGA